MRDRNAEDPDQCICEDCGKTYFLTDRHENPYQCPKCMKKEEDE